AQARQAGVSAASLFHLAWALVVGRTAGRDEVVFGTVLFGRMQGGAHAERALGMFINTLPVRIGLAGDARAALVATHRRLTQLLRHEHASLALAQQCSGVAAPAPLRSALEGIVAALESGAARAVRELPILPPAEREALARAWQRAATTFPGEPCL
uniref:condensation domain-containing protein n=1 Tax=Burkholderia cepacia TaxID=292 RepID=UPI001ABAA0BF